MDEPNCECQSLEQHRQALEKELREVRAENAVILAETEIYKAELRDLIERRMSLGLDVTDVLEDLERRGIDVADLLTP